MTTDNRSTLAVKLHIHKPPTSSTQGASVIQCNKKNVAWNSQLPLASIRSHAVTAGQNSDKRWLYELFICVSRREKKQRGGVRVYLRVTLLSFSTLHCHSVFLARGLGPSHIHNKNRNAPLLQLKFIWHNLSAVIFSLCICRRKTLASILHSFRDQSHRATQKSWRTPQAQTCL